MLGIDSFRSKIAEQLAKLGLRWVVARQLQQPSRVKATKSVDRFDPPWCRRRRITALLFRGGQILQGIGMRTGQSQGVGPVPVGQGTVPVTTHQPLTVKQGTSLEHLVGWAPVF